MYERLLNEPIESLMNN